jgi:hypothetical protein
MGRSCFRISAMNWGEWSACVRWCLSPSAAIVTQLVTRSPESLWLTVSAPLIIMACRLSVARGRGRMTYQRSQLTELVPRTVIDRACNL